MAIRDPENFGKPISDELADYVKKWTTNAEMQEIANQHKVSLSTVRDLVYSKNNLTKKNVDAFEDLVRKAVLNYTLKKQKHEKITKKIITSYENDSD